MPILFLFLSLQPINFYINLTYYFMENKTLEELQDLEKRISNLLNDVRLRIRLIELDKYRDELCGLQKEMDVL